MADLRKTLQQVWPQREGPVVLTTVDSAGVPNAVYALGVKLYDDGAIAVVDNYFHKTRINIKNGSQGSVLFLTKDRKAFQAKGAIEYYTEGPLFDDMRIWANPKFPRLAVAVVRVDKLYSGAEDLS